MSHEDAQGREEWRRRIGGGGQLARKMAIKMVVCGGCLCVIFPSVL